MELSLGAAGNIFHLDCVFDDPPPLPIEGRDGGNEASGELYSGGDDRGVVNEVFEINAVNVVFHTIFQGPAHDPQNASELFGS